MALTFKEPDRARQALDRALELDPNHHGALYWRAEAFWVQGDVRAAARLLRHLNDIVPDVSHNLARLGFAYLAAGDSESARRTLTEAVEAGGGLENAQISALELRRAFYLDALDRHDDALKLVQSVNASGPAAALPSDRYPRDLEAQRCALENIVAGRDIVILGSGPSLEQLVPVLRRLGPGGSDRLCFFGFNNVPVVERMLRETIGRGVDLACMTSAAVADLYSDWLAEFLSRPEPTLLLSPATISPPGPPERLFCFTTNGDYPPIPTDPLHFPPVNTLICVLPLALLSQPGRVFLFGCDGAAPAAQDGAPVYFRQDSPEFERQTIAGAQYARWLARDTFFFNALVHVVLSSLSILHRIPIAPVYLCNPESAYRPFPRISASEFLSLHASRPRRTDFFPARASQLVRQLDGFRRRAEQDLRESPGTLLEIQTQIEALRRAAQALDAQIEASVGERNALRVQVECLGRRIEGLSGEQNALQVPMGTLRREMDVLKRYTAPLRAIRNFFLSRTRKQP